MAIIYARTTGNDTTGTGATGAPYATLKKAISVAVSGDVILMGSGTYAEDSGGGVYTLASFFVNFVQIQPESGNLGDVVITGVSGSFSFIVSTTSLVMFRNIVFRSHGTGVLGTMRFFAASIDRLRFVSCRWEVLGVAGTTNLGITTAWNVAGLVATGVEFIDCEIRQINEQPVAGASFDVQTGSATGFRFVGMRVNVGNFGMRLKGLQRFELVSPDVTSFDSTIAGTAIQIGEDAATGSDTTGRLTNVKAKAMTGHAMVLGAGCSNIDLSGNSALYGGDNGSNGQGLVVKNVTGARISGVHAHGGALSTLYLKAAQNALVEDSFFYSRYSTASALRVGVNSENGSKASNCTVRRNYFEAYNGQVISWDDATGDAGGNVSDQNVYNATGTASLGTVRGTAVSTLAQLRAAWVGYDRPANDRCSRLGLTAMRHMGPMVADLA